MTKPLDPAKIMATHAKIGYASNPRCVKCPLDEYGRAAPHPCLPYRLASEIERLTRELAEARATRERLEEIYDRDQRFIKTLQCELAEARRGPVAEIAAQRARNHARWGDQSIEVRPPDYRGWLPTLGEEFGEVCRAQTLEQNDPDRLRAELIDLAAVALMWLDSIDRAALAGEGAADCPEESHHG